MITVEGLTKRFGDFTAVDNVSFRVNEGEILGFLGPNGAGKTTTMRMLTGYLPATSGTATIAGFDIHEKPDDVRRRIGYLPEHPPLYDDLTVTAYLDFVARIKGMNGAARREGVPAIMAKCGLTEVAGKLIKHLSKGFRQRVGIAQALVHNPPVLILDEPTIGLDPAQIIEIRQLITALRAGHTVILSTHILPEVTQICDRVVIINRGRIVADDTPQNLARATGQPGRYYFEATGSDLSVDRLREIAEVAAAEPVAGREGAFRVQARAEADLAPRLAEAAAKNGWAVRELRRDQVTLEEAYIRLTSG